MLFAEKVRDHKGLESRWAVLQETRVEYFRGKDFVTFLKNHPEVRDLLGSDKSLEAEDIADTLLKKNLIVRCDRVVKTLRPGKKKLSTWPAHLEIYPVRYFLFNPLFPKKIRTSYVFNKFLILVKKIYAFNIYVWRFYYLLYFLLVTF